MVVAPSGTGVSPPVGSGPAGSGSGPSGTGAPISPASPSPFMGGANGRGINTILAGIVVAGGVMWGLC